MSLSRSDRLGAVLSVVSADRLPDSSGLSEFRLDTVGVVPEALRDQVRRTLTERDPIDDAERASIERTLTELDRLADPFDRESDPIHVTGSAVVVGPRGVVLLKHKRLGLWLQPGGHVDAGETPWEGALREAREETGLDVTLKQQMHTYSDPARDKRFHTITTVYVATGDGQLRADDDAADAAVFTRDTLPRDIVFDHRAILEDYYTGKYAAHGGLAGL